MARGGVLKADPNKGVPGQLVRPVKDSHAGAEKMIGGIRAAKNKMRRAIRDAFPDI